MPGSIFTTEVSLSDWPNSDSVGIELQWLTSGTKSTDYLTIETEKSQEGLNLPFDLVSAAYGLLAGILTILVGTFVWRGFLLELLLLPIIPSPSETKGICKITVKTGEDGDSMFIVTSD